MIEKSFSEYLKQLAETAKMLGDPVDSAGIPNEQMRHDYLPSMISAESESINLLVEKDVKKYWTPTLQTLVREQLAGIEDIYGNPCRLKVSFTGS
jgi:RAB protein geranylgeranyltransferase component A